MTSQVFSDRNTAAEIKTANFSYSETAYPVDHWMSLHRHSRPQLFLCLAGAVEHHTGRDRFFFAEHSGGYIARDEVHSDLFLGNARALQIAFDNNSNSAISESIAGRAFDRHHPAAALLKKVYQEFRNPDDYTSIMLEALTLEVVISLRRQGDQFSVCKGRSRWLDRARELIHEEFSESLTLEQIALEVGVHPGHLAKAFRSQFGESVGEYIRRLRIAKARHLLEVTEMSIGSIALATGFGDQSHFARSFKKYTGLTPNTHRGCQKAR